ncbi:MAG: PrsW family intramembrane metalloprotease [Planctomycetes bacterium]|nr:PrsW family intramembrane metalloprotease [Planctomycetota bacterium]
MFQLRVQTGCRAGEVIPLPAETNAPLSLGRGREAEVRFPEDATMSRVHAELHWRGGWSIENKSQHGTYVGARRAKRRRKLKPGDVLVLGDTEVVFQRAGAEAPRKVEFTPATPHLARPPASAGYDADGNFHMGQTFLAPGDAELSFIQLGGTRLGVRVRRRRAIFFTTVAILAALGVTVLGVRLVLPLWERQPRVLAVATCFGLLPALPYLFLIKLLDRNNQIPWRNVLGCLVWGGTIGCGVALLVNGLAREALTALLIPGAASGATAAFVAPVVEELIKGLGVAVLIWILHDEFDNALEGLVLGATCGLGFALVENALIYDVRFLARGGEEALFTYGLYRTLVNALIGHPVYTAMFGAGLGFMRETARGLKRRWAYAAGGLALAIVLHLVWNWAAIFLTQQLEDVRSVVALGITTGVFGGIGVLFFVSAYAVAASRERHVLLTYLDEEQAQGFVQPEELESFRSLFGRERWELAGLASYGVRLYRLRRRLRAAQVELALRKWHLGKGDRVRGSATDAYVRDARERIRDARNALNAIERSHSSRLPRVSETGTSAGTGGEAG